MNYLFHRFTHIRCLFTELWDDSKKLIQNLYENFTEGFMELFWYFPKDVGRFIVKLWQYSPLLWNDRDYDYNYILLMLKYKISRTRKCILTNDIIVNNKKYAKQMKVVEDIIDRITESPYHDEAFVEMEAKWGKNIWFEQSRLFHDCKHSVRMMSRYEKENGSNKKLVRRDVVKAYKKETRLEQKDWNKLWKLLNKNLRFWWD